MDLTPFVLIERFSWIGPWSIRDFNALCEVLTWNAEYLERLHLDFVSQSQDKDDEGTYQSFVASNIFNLGPNKDQTVLSSLRELSLCSIAFNGSDKELLETLNILGLSSLSLQECSGWENLLARAIDDGQLARLLSLEITYLVDRSDISHIWHLLPHTRGIKDLYISVLYSNRPSPFTALAEMQIQLTRLIYHTRKLYETNYSDSDNIEFDDFEFDEAEPFLDTDYTWWQSGHPCAGLQYLGLSCGLPALV